MRNFSLKIGIIAATLFLAISCPWRCEPRQAFYSQGFGGGNKKRERSFYEQNSLTIRIGGRRCACHGTLDFDFGVNL